MHHQLSMVNSGSWFLSVLVISLIFFGVGFTIYWFCKRRKISNTSTEEDEEELGWEYCPNLMVELYRLKKELKNLKTTLSSSQS